MAWRRDDTNLGISGSTAYAYTRVDWSVGPTSCSYRHIGGVTSSYYFSATATSTLQWWENGTWHDYESGSHYFGGYEDQPICDVRDSFVRTASDRSVSLGCYTTMMGGAARAWLDYTVPHLPDIIPSLTATKVSDNQMNLEWTLPSTAIDGVEVAVFVDNGSRSTVAILNGSPTSYQYTGASAGHLYGFSVRARYQGAWCSTWTGTGYAIATTPVPPESITASAVGGTAVDITLTNPTFLATSVEYEVSTDGGETWGATQESASTTSFQTNISGSGKVRVRNVYENQSQGVPRITGTEWLVSGDIVTICPPAAPTLTSPSGTVVDMADGSVTFSWLHNSLDGSAQTAAQLAYSTDGGQTWTTQTLTTAQSYTVSPIPWAAGTAVTWKVRTKGAAATGGPDQDYPGGSPWAQAKTFSVYTAPTLSITSPGATITGMPVNMTATYSDMAGYTCNFASVKLTQNGREVYPNDPNKGTSASGDVTINGSTITASLTIDEFLPTNRETYTVVVTARSSSSLQTTANATFLVDFTEPVEGTLQVQNDLETGYVSLLAEYDNTGADEPAVSISVSRVNPDGTVTPLLTDGQSGAGIVDRYAPLNTQYQYAVSTKASSQAVKTVYVDNIIESDMWFAYWGENIASAKWNPENGGIQVTRPSKTRVYYAGRRDPVSYDGHAVALTETPSWVFLEKSEVDLFVKLIEDGGRGIYKSCDGWVYHADFDLTLTPSYTAIGYYGGASLGITRIAGDRL